jgi:2-isopropylmalate synthase
MVLSKLSGRHGLRQALTRMGITLSDDELQKAYDRFVELADKKKVIYDDDLMLIASEQMSDAYNVYTLDALQVAAGSRTIPTATVRLRRGDVVLQEAACGDGPVDAACKAIDRMANVHGRLLDYALQAVTIGKDAMGEVSLRVAFGDSVISAKAASTDIVEASAKAYLSCVNRHITMKENRVAAGETHAPAKRAPAKRSAKRATGR